MGLISRVSSRTYRGTMNREKLSLFDKKIAELFEGISVDRFETLNIDQKDECVVAIDSEQQLEQQDLSESSTASTEESNGSAETTVLCTKCNIPLPIDLVERRAHYKTEEHIAKLKASINSSSPRLIRKEENNSPDRL